ncbi:DUF2258 domain-containing protein [Candidatus Bathyarchaeota archaeon]|nr:DUF2258 domain-containing protein [Candidatus Bathyarchaeota archaeon]MBS7612928.1 DUF2258 domain-containing protein [Candidatus Bathyarchaeota archaeon]MBS7618011.1 DUF2258 domain-containing protein [Candidatus Bathyarchaeota archaeon]
MSIQSFEKVELRTGVIPAALYAGKLRKVALAVFRSLAPRDVILRDVAKLNQTLYGKLVEELKLSKGDFVRITVKAFYDKDKGELSFEVPHVERLVFESDVKQTYEAKIRELEEALRKAETEREYYRKQLENLKKSLEELLKAL